MASQPLKKEKNAVERVTISNVLTLAQNHEQPLGDFLSGCVRQLIHNLNVIDNVHDDTQFTEEMGSCLIQIIEETPEPAGLSEDLQAEIGWFETSIMMWMYPEMESSDW